MVPEGQVEKSLPTLHKDRERSNLFTSVPPTPRTELTFVGQLSLRSWNYFSSLSTILSGRCSHFLSVTPEIKCVHGEIGSPWRLCSSQQWMMIPTPGWPGELNETDDKASWCFFENSVLFQAPCYILYRHCVTWTLWPLCDLSLFAGIFEAGCEPRHSGSTAYALNYFNSIYQVS